MKRLVALAVAVGLVVGAVFLRRAMDDDSPDDGTGAGGSTLICATEVAAACAEAGFSYTTEEPAVTAERLGRGDPLGADAWLVSRPWLDLANFRRENPGPGGDAEPPVPGTGELAHSPLGFASRGGLGACSAEPTWTCLAGRPSGVGVPPPTTTDGLLSLAQIYLTAKGSDPGLSVNDPAVGSLLGAVATSTNADPGNALGQFVALPGSFAAIGVTEATKGQPPVAPVPGLDWRPSTPPVEASVTLAGDPRRFDPDRISAALTATGWQPPRGDAAPTGVPEPGVMESLVSQWNKEIR